MMLVFLLEERSMKELLDGILPKILPEEVAFRTIPHSGKSDLRKSIPRKLRNWNVPDTRFVIVHDQDSHNCFDLKKELENDCCDVNKSVLIRIACHELEAWYFGDLTALSKAYNRDLEKLSAKRKYRDPDKIENPKEELRKLVPEHEQINGARIIAPLMDIQRNSSQSFNTFVQGVQELIDNPERYLRVKCYDMKA